MALLMTNEALPRTIASGTDPEELGRWSWVRIQGRDGVHTRVLSAYRPVKNTSYIGSTYQQQLRYFRSQNNHTDPLELFDKHLLEEITPWLAAGDHVIISMDANQDVRTGKLAGKLATKGMRECILEMHEDNPPETYKRNTTSTPIDGIFLSPGLQATAGGYCKYTQFCASDHRTLWVDISFQSMLGHQPPPPCSKS